MGTRVLVEWAAGGLVAGQLAAGGGCLDWRGASVGIGTGCVCAIVALASPRWRDVARALAVAVAAGLVGGVLVLRASAVPDDPNHVAHLRLPLRGRVVGRVVASPAVDARRTIALVDVHAVGAAGTSGKTWGLVRLRIRGPVALERDEIIAVDTTLRRPRNFANPGGFDLVGLLARRGVHAVASVWDAATIERLGRAPTPAPLRALDAWRASVRAAVADAGAPAVTAVLTALVLGDEGAIAADVRRAFTRAGVVHVLSVSGLHVGIVTAAVAGALAWLVGRSAWLLVRIDRRKIALAGGLVAAVAYGALTGFAVATLRSLVMAGVLVLAVLLDRGVDPWRLIALAAAAIALAEPGAPCDISYQLSFASVGALLAGAARVAADAGRPAWRRWSTRVTRAAAAAWIGTAPLTAFHFHQVSLVSVVANPFVVPLFEGVAVLPALAGAVVAPVAPGAARLAMAAAAIPLRGALALVDLVGNWRWAALEVPLPTLGELVLVYGVIGGCWWRAATIGRALAAGCLVLLACDAAWWAAERTARADVRVTFLDVGQGDAAVVELAGGRVLVVDAGGFAGSDFDTGAAIVEPFLRTRKIARVDALVMSHAHPDHAAGLASLVRAMSPAELWWSGHGGVGRAWDETVGALGETGTPVRLLRAGDVVPDFPEIDVLHPPRDWSAPSLNDGSLVLRVRDGAMSVLLTGDAEQAAEARMLDGAGPLAAAVLKVPHHGSRTSSGLVFLAAVAPTVAVASLGADNHFGHPAPEVVARHAARGIVLYRTDRCGSVTVTRERGRVRVETARPCGVGEAIRTPARP